MVTIAPNGALTLKITVKKEYTTQTTDGMLVLMITNPAGEQIILKDSDVALFPGVDITPPITYDNEQSLHVPSVTDGIYTWPIPNTYKGTPGIWKIKVMSDQAQADTTGIASTVTLKTLGSFAYRVITLDTAVSVVVS